MCMCVTDKDCQAGVLLNRAFRLSLPGRRLCSSSFFLFAWFASAQIPPCVLCLLAIITLRLGGFGYVGIDFFVKRARIREDDHGLGGVYYRAASWFKETCYNMEDSPKGLTRPRKILAPPPDNPEFVIIPIVIFAFDTTLKMYFPLVPDQLLLIYFASF